MARQPIDGVIHLLFAVNYRVIIQSSTLIYLILIRLRNIFFFNLFFIPGYAKIPLHYFKVSIELNSIFKKCNTNRKKNLLFLLQNVV